MHLCKTESRPWLSFVNHGLSFGMSHEQCNKHNLNIVKCFFQCSIYKRYSFITISFFIIAIMYFQVDQDWFTYRPFLISLLNISFYFLKYVIVYVWTLNSHQHNFDSEAAIWNSLENWLFEKLAERLGINSGKGLFFILLNVLSEFLKC